MKNNIFTLIILFIFSSYVFADTSENLLIENTKMSFINADDSLYVSVVGKLKNTSNETIENPVLEIQYFDKEKKLIDAATEYFYSVKIKANDSMSFNSKTLASEKEDLYASHSVRVVGSEKPYMPAKNSNCKKNKFKKTISKWWPLLLFLAVWVFLVFYTQRKGSPQNKTLDLIQQQVRISEEQNKILERLAKAAENKNE